MITAKEARGLAPMKLDETLERMDSIIRNAAEKGQTSARVPYDLCNINGYSASFKSLGAEEALEDAGFSLETRNEDRQFVDVWIEVSWTNPTPAPEG